MNDKNIIFLLVGCEMNEGYCSTYLYLHLHHLACSSFVQHERTAMLLIYDTMQEKRHNRIPTQVEQSKSMSS